MRIGYQGEPGAFSEEAVVTYLGTEPITPVPCKTFDDAFERLAAGEIEAAVLPVENSYAGDVGEVYDLLRRNDVWIYDELALPVRHCLMALPGVTLKDLRCVRSHPQALSQCRDFLRRHGLWAEPIHDTAAAARQVAEEGRRDLGAIAARRAAGHHGLAVLAEGIQDAADNTTRFLVVAPQGSAFRPEAVQAAGSERSRAKTYLLFAVADRPGALYRCLGVLAAREINMTKLTSRPFPGRPWYYMFFADLEGTIEDSNLASVLDEIRPYAVYLRVLGSFPARPLKRPVLVGGEVLG